MEEEEMNAKRKNERVIEIKRQLPKERIVKKEKVSLRFERTIKR